MSRRTTRPGSPRRSLVVLLMMMALVLPATAVAAQDSADPREGLAGGLFDAEEASENMNLLASVPRPPGFFDPANPGDFSVINSDLAFTGNYAIQGNYGGFLIYDISEPEDPELAVAVSCPGGQGDVSVSGDLLFVSVQQLGTHDCTPLEEGDDPFLGVRVFDISNIESPEQVATVEACRGSHTHTLVEDPNDDENVYIYVSGTNQVRTDDPEGLDCVVGPVDEEDNPSTDPDDFDSETETSRYQIEVIQVPVANPEDAAIVSEPRVMQDYETGNPVGLLGVTDACHDITAYPEIGLAAGACEGNGLLLDITDPVNPVRIDAVEDQTHFAYWHSATFNNDGTKVIFTDELGGGVAPTCLPDTDPNDGANAIYDIVEDGDGNPSMEFASYYKIPNVQTDTENCVAHNGSLLPVPDRDILVQSWYQGGISVMDFTDSDNPVEIAFFDRGPIDEDELVLGGYWSAYYYNGYIYGSEIARGFDVHELTESEHLSAEELQQAADVRLREFNPQAQPMITDADRSACAGVEPITFDDVAAEPHGGNVSCIAGYGIALGFDDGTFRPGLDISRDQMASFIQRELMAAGVELPASPAEPFDDVEGNTHELAINQLAELEIVLGKDATTYDPDDEVTRAQMASLVVRAVEFILEAELPSPSGPFDDVTASNPHRDAINAAYAAGIVQGRTETTYAPGDDVRRDQMGSFIARSLELLHYELVELNAVVHAE